MVEATNLKKPPQLGNKKDQNPKQFYSRFIFKSLILIILCGVVPLFLSQTPELANQTRLLELLHFIFVGIAVSYGLFSSRNYDGGGGGGGSNSNDQNKADHHHNRNNLNSYVPKLLEVSSVFDVDHESESEPSDDSSNDHHKFQTWRNKYHPEVETRFVDRVSSEIREKPLLLPVRNLNYSRVSESSDEKFDNWDKVRCKRQLLKTLGDDNSDVLPSPIPWRSRSSSQPSVKIESQPVIKNPIPSPRKSTPFYNPTSEYHPSPPPPPPPPPPLPAFYNSASRKENPGIYRSEPRESTVQKKKFSGGQFHPPPPPPPPPPADYYKSPPTKLKTSRKSSEQKLRRNSSKKVGWSDPVAESKEQETQKDDQRGYLGSKANEETENNEVHDEVVKKMVEEEGVSGINSGSDVDKKADEFIAKFREQIRLQRIESIKRSANKISANSSSR